MLKRQQYMNEIKYPVRINRYLYLCGICSRRRADKLITEGKVYINSKKAVLGAKVESGDIVDVDAEVAALPLKYKYYLYNKPKGVVSHNANPGEESVAEASGLGSEIFPVGRLDKDSRGLMLLTNDGRIVNSILNPEFAHEREYIVRVNKYIKEQDLKRLARGVDIEGYSTRNAYTNRNGEKIFSITLTEGKKHQIRRMCATLGYQVQDLKRTRIMDFKLNGIKENESRALSVKERDALLEKLSV
jgi:23S rRNA pseudouridine2604 synthase